MTDIKGRIIWKHLWEEVLFLWCGRVRLKVDRPIGLLGEAQVLEVGADNISVLAESINN